MAVKTHKPLTPARRFLTVASFADLSRKKPEKRLVRTRKRTGGRNCYGRITARAIGGGHKQKVRTVDFRRRRHGIEAEVAAIEYDPVRSARLALLVYEDGERSYIVAPEGLGPGDRVSSGPRRPPPGGLRPAPGRDPGQLQHPRHRAGPGTRGPGGAQRRLLGPR